jgi:hypothetical protein
MLSVVQPAYLYQEYADDDNLAGFVDNYNTAIQIYVTWFATVGLPYYPGLTGDLLSWVGQGLYGLPKTALASVITPATGELNTVQLNTTQLNAGAAPTQTFYDTNDDVYQRILTWHLFKGDGNQFNVRWLKRRIMRFLVGSNGIDPEPWLDNFVVGPENTTPISVGVTSGTLTVTINQALLSALVQIAPGILPVFKLAFLGGDLELPLQYVYECNLQVTLFAMVSPLMESSAGTAASQTTGSATVTLSGGSGSYTYAWTWASGGTGITINSPSAMSTSFTASGLTLGQGVSGTALCTVTDTVTTHTATAVLPVSLERAPAVAAVASPTALTTQGGNATITTGPTTVSASGGSGVYTYAWTWQSGGANITIASPTTASTTFVGSGLTPSTTYSGTALCTVTDSYGQTGTVTVAVSIQRVSVVGVTVTPSTLSATSASADGNTGYATAGAYGGSGTYTFSWGWQLGGTGINIVGPTAASVYFQATSQAPGTTLAGTAQVTVTDSYGQSSTGTVSVSIVRVSMPSAVASPSSELSHGVGTTQTTGASTVTASGGTTPYVYSWTWASGGAHIGINTPNAATTSFTGSAMSSGNTYSGVARCTVTDAYGQQAIASVSVTIQCGNLYQGTMVAGAVQIDEGDPYPIVVGTGYNNSIGSLSPTTDQNGRTISSLIVVSTTAFRGAPITSNLTLSIVSTTNPTQSYFTTLEIGGYGNLTSASATYAYSAGIATWTWTSGPFTSGTHYSVILAT